MRCITVALLAVLTCSGFHAQSPNKDAHSNASQREGQGPEILVQSQPDSPLRLSVNTKWVAEGRGYEIVASVKNVGDRAVTAYTTRRTPESGQPGGCALWKFMSSGKVLRPGQSEVKSTWLGFSPSDPPLTYGVDFVEFTDGTTWGADVCQSAERLAGERAGGAIAARYLLELLAGGGADAVMNAVKEGLSNVSPPAGHSPVWDEGFRFGTKVIAERVRRAVEEYGPEEIEHTLRRPYDAGSKERA